MIKERLNIIIKELGISGRMLEKECGLANGSFSSIGNGVGADKLNKILVRYPQISADWLLTGKGKMLKPEEFEPSGEKSKKDLHHQTYHEKMGDILSKIAFISSQQLNIAQLIAEIEYNRRQLVGISEAEHEITDSNDFNKPPHRKRRGYLKE